MSLHRFITSLFLFLSTGIIIPRAYGQVEPADSTIDMSRSGKNALSDALFFDGMKAIMHDDDKLAMQLLEKYVAERPEVSAAWYELSKLNYGDRKIDKAEEYIKKAIALGPENKWYKEEYASLLADRGAFLEAAKVMAELCNSVPDDPNYPVVAAEYYDKAKKYADALSYLDKALVRNGEDEDILTRKVQVYLDMNDVEKAAAVVRTLIVKEPKNGRYYKYLADLYENNKQPAKAAEIYDNAKKIIPDDPFLQQGIAEHYLKAGDTASYIIYVNKAIANKDIDVEAKLEMVGAYLQTIPNDSIKVVSGLPMIRQIAAQYKDDTHVLLVYSEFLESGNKHDSALILLKRSLQLKPNSFDVWDKLLANYTERKDADSLVKYSEKAMRLFPNLAKVHYYNSIGHLNRKEYTQAINAIKRAIEMQPENDKQILAAMYSLQGDEYHSNKQDDLSDKAFDKALELDPDNSSVLNNYSYYLSERGKKLDEAERMSQKSLDLRPDEATYLDTYGWIQYKKGNFLKAKDYVVKAINLSGTRADGALYDHLGNICYQLNEKEKAIEYWKKAKELGGSDDLQIDKKISEGKLYE